MKLEPLLEEVRLLQSLQHDNIVQYLDSSIDGDELIIVIEWAAAGDLKRQVRKANERGKPFEERVIWKYFSQICDAITHMHSRRILGHGTAEQMTTEELEGVRTMMVARGLPAEHPQHVRSARPNPPSSFPLTWCEALDSNKLFESRFPLS